MKIRETHKVVVMGAGGVGKTSLVVQFMEGFFSSTYKPTIEDYYRHTVQMPDGIFHTVEILDTAGTHYFPAMRELSIHSGRGFVLVFSVDSIQSFHETVTLYELITKIRGTDIPIVLVGNKSDTDLSNRKVSTELIERTRCGLMNNIPYVETSAKFNSNVTKLFMELLLQARQSSINPMNLKKNRKLMRRLGSFGSLPNISLIRKKSGNPETSKNSNNVVHHQLSLEETNTKNRADPVCSLS
ncbi:GTP-binding protein Di-Ras1-like [Brevipalpus obovatus]|uniref:GTP-binding protein Di-Ras1-like n=1 Tax=Brevipalpus obovatus TaxID=246614 RepID=UPI003D9EE8F7